MPVTMKDVAQEAGVAVSTASRALSGRRRVSPEVEAAVRAAAERLGYQVDSVARSLRTRTTGTVGMVVPEISNPYFPALVQEIEHRLSAHEQQVVLCGSQGDPRLEADRVRALLSRRVDGLFFVPVSSEESVRTLELAARDVPVVQLDRTVDGADVDSVGLENDRAITTMVGHLGSRGCRSFAYVTSTARNSTTRERLDAYRRVAGRIDPASAERVLVGNYSLEWGREASARLRAQGGLPDAIVCAADIIALGVMADLAEAGVQVPGDVAVTGLDDIGFARVSRPGLTTLRQPVELIAEAAVEILRARLDGDDAPARRLTFPPELVIRGSTP